MTYDKQILSAVRRELEQENALKQQELQQRRAEVYQKIPRIREIDRLLSGTAAAVLHTALSTGQDPEQAIARLRDNNLALQQERSFLLQHAAYPKDYLADVPRCAQCGDTGYLGSQLCNCMQQRYAARMTKELSAVLPIADQNFQRFRLDFYPTEFDNRLGVSPRENMEATLSVCKRYANEFSTHSPNLLMHGSTGLGKTFLSSCIAAEVAANGFSVVYDTAINIIACYETLKFGNGNGEDAALRTRRYEHADLLIIDDMGTEMGTAFTVSALYNLINNRLMTHRPMIISTNLKPDQLSEQYSPAVASRLRGEFRQLRFLGKDIRQMKRN